MKGKKQAERDNRHKFWKILIERNALGREQYRGVARYTLSFPGILLRLVTYANYYNLSIFYIF